MNINSITFRVAVLNDAHAIAELVNSAYRGESSRLGWTTEADLLDGQRTDVEEISKLIQKEDSVIFLALKKDTIIGSVHLEKQESAAYLGMFTVNPNLQASGIGKKFISAAEKFVQQHWSSNQLLMTVITVRKELISWYERRGYRRTGKLINFPYGEQRFGIPKVNDLKMEILEKPLV